MPRVRVSAQEGWTATLAKGGPPASCSHAQARAADALGVDIGATGARILPARSAHAWKEEGRDNVEVGATKRSRSVLRERAVM